MNPSAEAQKKIRQAQQIGQQIEKRRNEDPAVGVQRRRIQREARNAELIRRYDLKNKAAKQHPSSYEVERKVLKSLQADDIAMAESVLANAMIRYPEQINLQLIKDSLPSVKQAQGKEERAVLIAQLSADLTWLKVELKKMNHRQLSQIR
jgi:hypothetical protein